MKENITNNNIMTRNSNNNNIKSKTQQISSSKHKITTKHKINFLNF